MKDIDTKELDNTSNNVVSIKYKGENKAPIVPAIGVFGGISPDGNSITCKFYQDTPAIPEESRIYIDAETGNGHEEIAASGLQISRDIVSVIIIPIQNAESIGNWLLDKVRERKESMAKLLGKNNVIQ